MAGSFQATIGKAFSQLINLIYDDINIGSMITLCDTAVTETAIEIHVLGKEIGRKSPVPNLCEGTEEEEEERIQKA